MFHGVKLLTDDLSTYGGAVGVLAVHSAIALADAVQVAATGTRYRGQAHGQAIGELEQICKDHRREATGIKHLAELLDKKHHFSYDERPVSVGELARAELKMERFFSWVNRTFPELARLGQEEIATDA